MAWSNSTGCLAAAGGSCLHNMINMFNSFESRIQPQHKHTVSCHDVKTLLLACNKESSIYLYGADERRHAHSRYSCMYVHMCMIVHPDANYAVLHQPRGCVQRFLLQQVLLKQGAAVQHTVPPEFQTNVMLHVQGGQTHSALLAKQHTATDPPPLLPHRR
jgi:hypothetical protein